MTVIDALRRAVADPFPRAWRDRFAAIVFIVAFGSGLHAFMNLEPRSGVAVELQGDHIVVIDVEPWVRSYSDPPLAPGMVATQVNGQPVLAWAAGGLAKPSQYDVWNVLAVPITSIDAIASSDVEAYETGRYEGNTYGMYSDATWALDNSGWAIALGAAIFGIAGWYLLTGRAGAGLQPLAIPIAVAWSVPLLVVPLDLVSPGGQWPATALLVLGLLPLADGVSGRIDDRTTRRDVRLVVVAIAVVVVALATVAWTDLVFVRGWRLLGAVAIPLLPAVVAARTRADALADAGATASRRVADSAQLVLVCATPAVAAMTMTFTTIEPLLWPVLLWIAALLAAGRFTLRPLVRVATRAQLQRDLVVAASEAERARLAADLHDDALQDLTLLVRRLDAAGDEEGAAQARAIADRLRDICGDLRLPILDDLGVGPALDWLVLRIERMAGGEVRLERSEDARPPADIELAVFRVAQEALANAVKHGRPPIVVRYRATESGVSLSVDDAGPGIDADAREEATAGGHFGLLNMQQRAEAVGALLDVRRWPGGGTHVALEWRAG
jgi:signal transduction histidine kinase